MTFETGDNVTVTNLDGEEVDGTVVSVLSETVSERPVAFSDEYDVLLDYWKESSVAANESVIEVDLSDDSNPIQESKNVYDYPSSRVSARDDK
jgi:hypothetical protein